MAGRLCFRYSASPIRIHPCPPVAGYHGAFGGPKPYSDPGGEDSLPHADIHTEALAFSHSDSLAYGHAVANPHACASEDGSPG